MIRAPAFFHVACPSCQTEFPVDPAKVPAGGIHAICSACQRVFPVVGEEISDVAVVDTEGATAEPSTTDAIDLDESSLADEVEVPHAKDEVEDEVEAPKAEAGGEVPEEVHDVYEVEDVDAEEPRVEDAADVVGEADVAEDVDAEVPPVAETVEAAPEPPTDEADAPDDVSAEPAPPQADDEPDDEPRFEDLSSLTSEAMADEDLEEQLASSALSLAADRFGKRDPSERARRLARVLVSDIIAYFPARFRESAARGTVKEDFEDEVKKSWKEYVDQVGLEVAESTPHFEDALNEILGKGEKIF